MSQSSEPDPTAGERPLLIQALCEVLAQGVALTVELEPAVYAAIPTGLANSGVGPHLRHSMDFCRRFLEGLEGGAIDYDRRERDLREELEPALACERLRGLIARLQAGAGRFDPTCEVRVRHDVPADCIAVDDPAGDGWTRSTLGRELLFVLSHTIHHYALMAMALRHQGVEPGPDFGVAPSTLRYWRTQPVAARG